MRTWHRAGRAAVGAAAALLLGAAHADIYTCTTADGRRITRDRSIDECANREQRVLNNDGSFKAILKPPLTPDELAEAEKRKGELRVEEERKKDARRSDRNLMQRYPNEAAHAKARNAALDDTRVSIASTQKRLVTLITERKPLNDEAEFYAGRKMPDKLGRAIDANQTSTDALKALLQNQQDEAVRIGQRFDIELVRLKRLWAGADAGSMGPLPDASSAIPAKVSGAR